MSATEAWAAVGGSPAFSQQWACVQRVHRKAFALLARTAEPIVRVDLALSPFENGVASLSTTAATTATITGRTESKGTSGNSSSSNNSNNSSEGMAWDYHGVVTTVVMRLARGALSECLLTRRACARALGRLALVLPDPMRFAVYCCLHELQMADTAPPHPRRYHPPLPLCLPPLLSMWIF